MKTPLRTVSHLACALGAAAFLSVPAVAPAESEWSERWLVAQLTTTAADVPVVGEIHARTRMVALHDVTRKGDRLGGSGVLCRLDIDSGSIFVDTILTDAFKRSLPKPVIDGVLEKGDEGTTFRTRRALVVVGAKLERPDKDPLPTSPRDDRVFDQDGDGKPGVTIVIDGIVSGEIYVAQRSWTRLSGKRSSDGSISGTVFFDNEQAVLGATSSMLDSPPPQRPLPSKSWFKMVRVPKDSSCEDARRITAGWMK